VQLAGSAVSIIMNNSLQTYGGDLALGANGIILSIAMFLVVMILGIAQGMQPIIGYNYGAGHQQRVMKTLRLAIITATFIMGAGWLCSILIPEVIVKGFTNDPELIAIAANGLRLNLGAFILIGSQIVICQFFQSIGSSLKAIFLSVSRQFLFLIPAILILPHFLGLNGIWYSGLLSDVIAVFISWIFLWKHIKKTTMHYDSKIP
jgi:Na+-driven multidrug efflux pump